MSPAAPTIAPRTKQAAGCCTPWVEPAVGPAEAADLARVAKVLGDPTRLRIVDTVRTAAPEAVCQCELQPLFGISQPAISRHLKLLVEANVLAVERRGLWAHYFIPADSTLEAFRTWLD